MKPKLIAREQTAEAPDWQSSLLGTVGDKLCSPGTPFLAVLLVGIYEGEPAGEDTVTHIQSIIKERVQDDDLRSALARSLRDLARLIDERVEAGRLPPIDARGGCKDPKKAPS